MTPRLYDQDSHQTEFEATVLSCTPVPEGFDIILDTTAFFPGGGGQEPDRGTLGGLPVVSFLEVDQVVHHILPEALPVGTMVSGSVDEHLRLSNMQQHSGEHVVSGLLHNHYGAVNVGFHMGTDEVTLDIDKIVTFEELLQIEKLANEAVRQNLPVTVAYPEPELLEAMEYRSKKALEGAVRIVSIGDLDRCACCAPHVRSTGEIGLIKILSCQKYKGGTRISMLCGERALASVNRFQEICTQIGLMFSTRSDQADAAVARLREDMKALTEEKIRLEKELMNYKAAAVSDGPEPYVAFESADPTVIRNYVNLLTAKRTGPVVIYIKKAPETYQYILASGAGSVKELGTAMNQALSGRGGGSDAMMQGTVKASESEIRAFWNC